MGVVRFLTSVCKRVFDAFSFPESAARFPKVQLVSRARFPKVQLVSRKCSTFPESATYLPKVRLDSSYIYLRTWIFFERFCAFLIFLLAFRLTKLFSLNESAACLTKVFSFNESAARYLLKDLRIFT